MFTHDSRAFVRLHPQQNDQPPLIHVSVHNVDRNVTFDGVKLTPQLTGTLRVTAVQSDAPNQCPGYLEPQAENAQPQVCSGNGKCNDGGKCECTTDYGGPACDVQILAHDKIETPPDDPDWLSEPLDGDGDGDEVIVELPPFSRRVISWTQNQSSESGVSIHALVLSGFAPPSTARSGVSDTRVRMFVKKPGENYGVALEDGPLLPSEYDFRAECERVTAERARRKVYGFRCDLVDVIVEPNSKILIALITDATKANDEPLRSAVVNFQVTRCGYEGGNKCPVRTSVGAHVAIPIAVVPVCIATIGITAIAIGVMLWLDRQHGFTSSVDRLSPKELDRMYPTERFRAQGRDRAESVASQDTHDCSICLCKFEESDVVRILQCEHVYHSECLDPWLTQNNASCPACRCDVRIQNLSDRRRLRRLVTFCLSPIVWGRRLRARRSGDNVDREPQVSASPDLETGLERPAPAEAVSSLEPAQGRDPSRGELTQVTSTTPYENDGDDDIGRAPTR